MLPINNLKTSGKERLFSVELDAEIVERWEHSMVVSLTTKLETLFTGRK